MLAYLFSRGYHKAVLKQQIYGGYTIMKEKVILAYSGGLDTTALIPWL